MGIVGGLKASGILAKVSLIILFISSVCVLVSISAVGWAINGSYRLGLWRLCPSDENNMRTFPLTTYCIDFAGLAVDWWASVVAMTVLGTVGTLLAWLTCMTYMFLQRFMGNSECAYVSAILAILAGLCIFVALVVFGVKFSISGYWLHYGFYLLIAPCFLDILAGIFLFINIRKSSATSPLA